MLYSSMHRPLWVKSSPAHDSVYAAEVPQKADRIAAAPRKEKVCQIQRSAGYAGKKQEVKVHHDEGVATHIDPESCAVSRESIGEALTGERIGQPSNRGSAG